VKLFIVLTTSQRSINSEAYAYFCESKALTSIICKIISCSVNTSIFKWKYGVKALLTGRYNGIFLWYGPIALNNLHTREYRNYECGHINGLSVTQFKCS